MAFDPSKYQQAIFDYVQHGTGHLVVKACAGAAKTSTAIWSLDFVDPKKRVLFLAFNKSIAETLQKRIPTWCKASTIHSQGYGIVRQLHPDATTDIDKLYNATQEACKESRWKVPKDERAAFLARIRKIVDLMRLTLTHDEDRANDLCDLYDIENWDGEVGYAMEVFRDVTTNRDHIDFTDMIYVPAVSDFTTKGYDLIYVDEFQDCSLAQYTFIKKLLRPGGRLILIGDPRQSIYAHLGCDADLFDQASLELKATVLPLSISYRCPAAVVKHAQRVVPEIEARPDAPEGKVVHEGSIRNVRDGDVVLCRTNFPLVQLCLSLLKDGRKAIVRGNDVGKGLAAFLKPWEGLGVFEMEQGVRQKHANLVRKLVRKYPDRDLETVQEYQSMSEKVQIVNVLAEGCGTVAEVMAKIARIFSDAMGAGITLSTVHRFKGLEAERVFIVEPQLIPFPYYTEQAWQVQQENNIDYVARTRAISHLEYIRDWSAFPKTMAKMVADKAARAAMAGTTKDGAGRLLRQRIRDAVIGGAGTGVDVTDPIVAAELRKMRRETLGALDGEMATLKLAARQVGGTISIDDSA